MSTLDEPDPVDRITRTCQIIVGALSAGVLTLLVVASVVDLGLEGPGPPGAAAAAHANDQAQAGADRGRLGTMLSYAAVALAAVALPVSFLVPGLIAGSNRRAIAAGTWTPPGHPQCHGATKRS
jgi:hypothetical protein